ncbi:MAG: YebC/PmpR family DNA-binding transcriptional regulator [Candidatus Izemoplasmatales bacterium]|nr:YebC/PmpR family DNA-binding transcriptional regulator [Candidatus Izemoplasmatales bacterium]MDY0139888.1 YebC/PmpR family DNA-binding transcriptional regulator [Candidatus Izemoplasmatales bacterium]
MGRAHEVRKAAMEKTAAVKSKLYAKFGKEIYMAAKTGGPDPDSNLTLKRIIERAKQNQVPADVIKRNIEKTKSGVGEDYSPARYEGFGPGGSTIIVECLTDNVNRTFGEVRACFTKTGGNLGVQNSVSYLYKYCSYVSFSGLTEDEALEALMDNECEVENIESDEDVIMITGAPGDLDHILESLKSLGKELEFYSDSVIWLPSSNIDLSEDDLRKFKHFLSMTDAIDDVQEVYHNVNLPEEE